MGVLERHPHQLQYEEVEDGYIDDNGDYHKGKSDWSFCIPCRAVPTSGMVTESPFDDGTEPKMSFVCYLERQSHCFKIGDNVRLYFKNGYYKEYKVKGYVPYSLQQKLWLE